MTTTQNNWTWKEGHARPLGLTGRWSPRACRAMFFVAIKSSDVPSSSSGTANHWIKANSKSITRQAIPIPRKVEAAPGKRKASQCLPFAQLTKAKQVSFDWMLSWGKAGWKHIQVMMKTSPLLPPGKPVLAIFTIKKRVSLCTMKIARHVQGLLSCKQLVI